jgi:hypothetical protein
MLLPLLLPLPLPSPLLLLLLPPPPPLLLPLLLPLPLPLPLPPRGPSPQEVMVRHTKADVPRIPAPIRIKVWLPFTRPEQQSYNTIVANLLTNLVLTTGIVGADGETRPPKPESMLHASNQVGCTPLLSHAATSFILEHPTTFLPPVGTACLPQQQPTTNRPPTTATPHSEPPWRSCATCGSPASAPAAWWRPSPSRISKRPAS